MQSMYYVGRDVHKETISYYVKDGHGRIHTEGAISASRFDLDRWVKGFRNRGPRRWKRPFSPAGFYDHLKPHAVALKVPHPLM